MSTRTVRLDGESEKLLAEIRRETGLSVSDALKRGLIALRASIEAKSTASPYEIYAAIELGPGGYARRPAAEAKSAVAEVIRRKHRR